MEDQPPPKRIKKSHHVNQPPDYCHCERCKGEVIQEARIIADHARKYPRRQSPPPREVQPEHEALGDQVNLPRQQSHLPLSPVHSPPPSIADQDRTPEPPDNRDPVPPPGSPDRNVGGRDQQGDRADVDAERENDVVRRNQDWDEDEELPDWEPDANWFDHPERQEDEDDLLGRLRELDQQDPVDPDEDGYDEDFGLPNGGDEGPPAREIPEFQMPVEEPPEPEDPPDDIDINERYAAFREHQLLRNAYVDALVQKLRYGATHSAIAHQLRSAKRTISTHPDVPHDDVERMAQTIRTVERRLGVDTDTIIKTYTLCPKCGRRYSPEYIEDSDSAECLNNDCDGILYISRLLNSGSRRRVPNRTYPIASPTAWLQHMLRLPGISELLRSEQDEDQANVHAEPITYDEWRENREPNAPLNDIRNGWGWDAEEAGLERVEDPRTGAVRDQSQIGRPLRFSSLPFPVSLTMSTDWFQPTKEGNYSVGACYLAINNLPRHLRFLRENMCLAIVMPGPREPNSYALDQILEPLIDELLLLQQGVRMTIREGDPPVYREQYVHVHLTQHIADLIARIKMGGGAGLRSERHFCLYCHTRLSSLSVPDGFIREDFQFRDPEEELSNAYFWKSLETAEDRKVFSDFTGNRFTALHQLPGWYTCTCSPLDAMHLLYQGGMHWIVKQILYAPGMLNKCRREDDDPIERYNACLDQMWIPNSFSRRPPKLGQANTRVKADQWKLTSRVIMIPLYMAFRRGDDIPDDLVPRGTRSSTGAKQQTRRAKLLHRERQKHYNTIGQPNQCPPLEQAFSTRRLQFHYQQVLRFCLATGIIDKQAVSPEQIGFAVRMLENVATNYVRNNVPVSPNFHYMMHFEECILKYGSVYNFHVWAMERANGIISHINHNGRSNGMMEGTLMRGWWGYTTLRNLIDAYRAIRNPSPTDTVMIEDLLAALRSGTDHAQQQQTLMAYIAQCHTAYTRLHGIHEKIRLSNQSTVINLRNEGLYEAVLNFCIEKWPRAGIFGPGMPQRVHLPPKGFVRHHSYVEHNGIRYGGFYHTNGKGYCYGYIDGRQAVRIDRVLHIEFPGHPRLRGTCVLVRLFRHPPVEPRFPWNTWANHLGISTWLHDELEPVIAISANRLSGVFALFDIPRTDGRYWVTVALDSVSPEEDEEI
ncbi:Protein CSF1 [Rhizoctonia solani]|uniref:Protein CSF1 n=1 Tax=Rhizoctonia solani TaxID=456999 RepID=A0A0K6G7J6_9AGAM|nr:Protein CSF1 [Rhizoctonia solani]